MPTSKPTRFSPPHERADAPNARGSRSRFGLSPGLALKGEATEPSQRVSLTTKLILLVPLLTILLGTLGRCLFETPCLNGSDEAGYYAWQQSWLVDRDLDPSNQLVDSFAGGFAHWTDIDGRRVILNKYNTGLSQAIIPVTALTRGAEMLSNRLLGTTFPTDGLSAWDIRAAWFAVALWSCAGIVCTFATVRASTRDPTLAALATTFAWLGSAAFAHTWKMSLWSHGVGLSLVAIVTWLCVRITRPSTPFARSLSIAGVIGLLGGLALVLRNTNALVLAPAGIYVAASMARHGKAGFVRFLTGSAVACVIATIPVGIELLTRKTVYGEWFFDAYRAQGEGFFWPPPHVSAVLFHTDFGPIGDGRGIVIAHPIVVIGLIGLLLLTRQPSWPLKLYGVTGVLAFIGLLLTYAAWWFWDLGFSFGARWSADLLTLLAVGIASFVACVHQQRRWRCVYYLLPLCVWSLVYCSGALAPTGAKRTPPPDRPLPHEIAPP
ncbi:MAG: hypothetical protein QM770_05610 [Tepidisphaeraceae bacterium]